MGGIADYSGAWVLQMPIAERATVRLALRNDDLLQATSEDLHETISLKISDLPLRVADARQFFQEKKQGEWAAYVLGCLVVLAQQKGLQLRHGLDFWVKSDVPIGKGVSSSAAIEVATIRALAQLFDLRFEGTEMARLAQMVENQVVGAPCGLMDQLASCHGLPDHLLPIQCQPDLLLPPVPLPSGIRFLGMDSGIRHAVTGASYGDVRTAAFMGLRIIEQELGRSLGGYLCRLSPSDFEQNCAAILPESMSGKAFLEKYGSTDDPVTTIDPSRNYAVRDCARHPVHENHRVLAFAKLLSQPIDHESLALLGELMFQSHASYSSVGLGCPHTDELVELVRSAGIGTGVFGAKITGGGSGGTVCVGCHGEEGLATARRIFEEYRRRHGFEIGMIGSC
jgi:galactokinase